MTSGIGSIRGQIRIDARQALAEYAAVRSSNAKTRASLGAASSSFARAGVGAIAAAVPIVLLFKAAVGAAADFEKKIDFFGAVTNASQADMQAVANKAMEMSKTTVYSAGQMADAFVEFGKAGIATKDILGGVAEATANLAQAADIQVQDAANIVVSTMATFHMVAGQSGHIADVLAGAANASIIDVSDLATSLKYAGGIAAATKVPFESVVTAIALLGNAGIKGSTAGTSLRQIMVSLTAQTSQAKKELKELGIITANGTNLFINQKGQIKPLAEVFQILQDHTRGLTDAQRLAALKVIFNSRALSSANILLAKGSKGFDEMSKSIDKVSAADVASKRLDNLSGDITHLKNSIQTMLIQAGGPLQDMLRVFVQGLTRLVQGFAGLPPGVQKGIILFLLLIATFLIVFGTISLILSAILRIIIVFRDFAIALRLLRTGITVVATAFRALSLVMLANPVFLIIAAIVLLVVVFVLLWKRSAAFRDFWKKLWADIKLAAILVWTALKLAFSAAIDWIVNTAKKMWKNIQDDVVAPVVKAWDAVIGAMKAARDWLVDAWNKVVEIFRAGINAVSNKIKDGIEDIKQHWTLIIAIVLGPLGLLIDLIHKHWDTIVRLTRAAWDLIYGVIKGIIGFIVTVITFQWNLIKTITLAIWNAVSTGIRVIWNIIRTIVSTEINIIVTVIRTAWNLVSLIFRTVWTAIATFFVSIWHWIQSTVFPIIQHIANFIVAAFRAIAGPISAIWQGFVNTISSAAHTIWNVVSGIGRSIINFFADAGSWLIDAGRHLVEGLWNGISSMEGWLADKVSGFASRTWHGFTNFFGIKSPSRLFHWAGRMLVNGLAQGIVARRRVAVAAAQAMARDITNASDIQAKYSLLANQSGFKSSQGSPARASQINAGKAQLVHVKVDDSRTAADSKLSIGRQVNIEHLNLPVSKPDPVSDTLYHTVQKILEDVI